MKIFAKITSSLNQQEIVLQTSDASKSIALPIKPSGLGSAVNGGELLLLALATCYCNDIYREAAKTNIPLSAVKVQCEGTFGAEGEPGNNFSYRVEVTSDAPSEVIEELIRTTDRVAEIHNTLRAGRNVTLIR